MVIAGTVMTGPEASRFFRSSYFRLAVEQGKAPAIVTWTTMSTWSGFLNEAAVRS